MKNSFFIIFLLLIVNGLWIYFSFYYKRPIQAATSDLSELVIQSPSGAKIRIGFEKDAPVIQLFSKEGQKEILLTGGDSPTLSLFDNKAREKVIVKGCDPSGILLKNDAGHVVATWTVLEDQGAGLGLADNEGAAASILRGGASPGLSFYGASIDPVASFGLLEKVAHFAVLGQKDEGILIHGGVPTSLILTDEDGALKLVISKHGIFKEKEKDLSGPPEKRKYFTYQRDLDKLFPDGLTGSVR